jgi:hypothetical protein
VAKSAATLVREPARRNRPRFTARRGSAQAALNGDLNEGSILALQQAAGNRAVVQRLTSVGAFKQATAVFAARRGKTLKEIERLLELYHTLKADPNHVDPSKPQMDAFQNVLHDLVEVTQLWLDDHKGDTSRSRHRRAGIHDLWLNTRQELHSFEQLRARFGQAPVGTQGPQAAPPAFARSQNLYTAKMQGSASKMLTFIGGVVSSSIPAPGDTSQLSVELQIPVDPSASAYVGVKVMGVASRMDKQSTKLTFNFAVTGGAKIAGVANLQLELGATVEAQGETPAKAMELISWGWYQKFREAKLLPREVANVMWGGSTSVVGWRRAERWAARVEKENFMVPQGQDRALSSGVGTAATTNAYVRTGGYFGAGASGGVGNVAKVGGAVQVGWGRHYDQDTIEARKQARGGRAGVPLAVPARRGTAKSLGTRYVNLSAALSVTAGPLSGSLTGNLEFLREGLSGRPKPQALNLWLNGGFTAPMNAQIGDKVALIVIKAAPELTALIHKIGAKFQESEKAAPGDTVGSIIDAGEGVTAVASTFPTDIPGSDFDFDNIDWSLPTEDPMQSASQQAQAGLSSQGPSATFGLSLGLGLQFPQGGGKPIVTADIALTYQKALELDVSLVKIGLTKGRRLMRVRYDGGWKVD